MIKFNTTHKSILERYCKPIVHMRSQIRFNRFGLVFGAGLDKEFGVPKWAELVDRIATDDDVKGSHILEIAPPRAALTYKTEMLWEHFKQSQYSKSSPEDFNTRKLDYKIGSNWKKIIRKHLYSGIVGNLDEMLAKHPYFETYIPIIQNTHMTVTYNFNDFVEQFLYLRKLQDEKDTRGFECVTNPWTQFKRRKAIIYHPNGVIPQNPLEDPSDLFVFSESSFAKQLIGIYSGDQAGLLNHFSKHTCLLIGLSLEDETLRNVLMQEASSCPGNYHYYIQFVENGNPVSDDDKKIISLANFRVYNLITLFLNNDEIKALGELIDINKFSKNDFCDFACENDIPVKFNFYLTGAMGVGKSTTLNYFRNLSVLDEWIDERLPVLAKDFEALPAHEKEKADKFVISQFKLKNDYLRNEREGIFILDRGPLDPLAFTQESEWNSKADRILSTLCPGQATWQVEDGKVILLKGDPDELSLRMVISQREEYTADKLSKMEKMLTQAYQGKGVVSVDTRGLLPCDVVKRVAEIIHLDGYKDKCNLNNRLLTIKKDGPNGTPA